MPTVERDGATIYYEETGNSSGYPLLLLAPGGLNSAIPFWHRMPLNPIEAFKDEYRIIAMDQRNAANSSGPLRTDDAWGMPREVLQTLPGYGPDVEKNRAEARKIMEKLGYGPDKRLAIKLSTRNFPGWRDYAVIMIDHLKEIYIDGELDLVDTAL